MSNAIPLTRQFVPPPDETGKHAATKISGSSVNQTAGACKLGCHNAGICLHHNA